VAQQTVDVNVGFEYNGSGTGAAVVSNAQKVSDNFDELYAEAGPLEAAVTAAEAAQDAAETAQGLAEAAQTAAEAAQTAAEAIAVSTKTNGGVGDQVAMSDTDAKTHTEKTSVGAALMAADDILVVNWVEWVDSVDSTPQFMGANPAEVKTTFTGSPQAGHRVLRDEEMLAFELVRSLDAAQKSAAVNAEAPKEIRAAGEPQHRVPARHVIVRAEYFRLRQFEVIEINDLDALVQDVSSDAMAAVASQFQAFADAPVFMLAERFAGP
jgi:hypothetical protein